MYVQGPPSPVVIVTDWRTRADAELDISCAQNGPHVLSGWKLGVKALGIQRYHRCRRVALFEHGSLPSGQVIARAKADWLRFLQTSQPLRVMILPTPDASLGEGPSHVSGSICLSALHPPDGLDALRLTAWQYQQHTVTPLFAQARRTKPMQLWANAQAMVRASRAEVLTPRDGLIYTALGGAMRAALRYLANSGGPVAVDLEFLPDRGIVTAIGVSDGTISVSVPWHDYTPLHCEEPERGVAHKPDIARLVGEVLAADTPKYFHNYVADVPRLQGMGLHLGGTICDTFAAHAIAFPELRHGLQSAAASMLYVPPWKSLYRPQDARGFSRDDEEFWTASPECHRDYNAKDAFYCWHLAQAVLPEAGINPDTGKPE